MPKNYFKKDRNFQTNFSQKYIFYLIEWCKNWNYVRFKSDVRAKKAKVIDVSVIVTTVTVIHQKNLQVNTVINKNYTKVNK